MSKKKSWIASMAVFLVFLTHSSFVCSASGEVGIWSLKGLAAIGVVVENLKPNIEGMGLTKEQIQTDIELKLRMAGIKVVSLSEIPRIPGMPYLYLNLNSVRGSQETFVFNIKLSLTQWVYLARNPVISGKADTWSLGYVSGYTGYEGAQMIDYIRDAIKDAVDGFINEYLSVNPKGGD